MAFDFKKGFNKFADMNNSFNKGLNNVIGKDVFGEMKKIEDERVFAPFSSFPPYQEPKPADWTALSGQDITFTIEGVSIPVSANLDVCMKYKPLIIDEVKYYKEQFKYRFSQCATDYDSFVHYFKDMYLEGMNAICSKTYSIFLPLGIFDSTAEKFEEAHINRFHKAYDAFKQISGIELARNANAANAGNVVGNSVRVQGGGFGLKGAAKGILQAEAINAAISGVGKFVEHQKKMSQEEKAAVWQNVNADALFAAVHNDYYNVFYSLVQSLSDRNMIGNATTLVADDVDAMYKNLQNPMFPQDKFIPAVADLISKMPFQIPLYNMLEQKLGATEEVKAIREYFLG